MTRGTGLGALCWPELDGSAVTLLVPLGAVEQHGPHLPLDTDIRIADAVARRAQPRLAGDRPDSELFIVAPGLPYGASGEHEGFPGTVSLGHEALRLVLVEYGRSACRWARRIVFVNGHGGNGRTLVDAVRLLRYEGREVAWFACGHPGGDAHAGDTETSVLLNLSPDDVRLSEAVAGNRAPIAELLSPMRSGGVAAVSANGVLGDPTTATADRGGTLLAGFADALVAAVGRWDVDERGLLRGGAAA
ncbi:mycofactocin biosynthesis peptidyl-dipeptidase MftE [Gordonia pseudamarae]|uniref:Mycofactocin biosynthesis peptidyl-dipeptidase MftE n=1 Tax=Gordonia pseudamarae TaxID=2831662 RepID=A0ABX6IM22_9ACTN|nr:MULTISPECIES: mycofactocin biosynthesis peptidyl-dipeptidase MftE [Gordonia]MBD0021109.1 mycofactocin biosynthesis peptidyl-dipeptidase MftE [Gordonia sp. (in: high G+C Gram-positive bacteria)]QHN27481.1 mycofactocin biosynthesis peptidyl-dipeptidase MftE [Gordonia pseudamarae]QHN36365.1 mycofactocin biosynthesis peptidyl-dipeptidase MftE [Gordonia pseudamarae]